MLLLLTCVSWKLNFPIIIPFFFVNKIILISFVRKKKNDAYRHPIHSMGLFATTPWRNPLSLSRGTPTDLRGKCLIDIFRRRNFARREILRIASSYERTTFISNFLFHCRYHVSYIYIYFSNSNSRSIVSTNSRNWNSSFLTKR